MGTLEAESDDRLLVLHARFRDPGAHVLALRGDVCCGDGEALDEAFARALEDTDGSGERLIVDLGGLGHGDAWLLGLLINAHRTGRMILVGPLSQLFQRRLHLTGTDELFHLRPSLAEALVTVLPAP